MQAQEVEILLKTIMQYEDVCLAPEESKTDEKVSPTSVQQLISLYNKAIEYYSAMNDEKHIEYLKKLQFLLVDERMQKILEASDKGIKWFYFI